MTETHCQIQVKISPNASKNQIKGWTGDVLAIRIQTPPVDGKANKALILYLSKITRLSKSRISIVRGETSRQKTIAFNGLEHSELLDLISPLSN
jgi:uncharacterized protein (TIGR00251 family)